MTPDHDNDNRQRPASFDAKVMAYLPVLEAKARKFTTPAKAEDLLQDTLAYIFAHWKNFRGDWNAPKSGFYNWLIWQMRSVVSGQKAKRRITVVYDHSGKYANTVGTPAEQERALMAKEIMSRATGRDGKILLRRGLGCGLKEISQDLGITVERVRQVEMRERASLRKVAGRVAA